MQVLKMKNGKKLTTAGKSADKIQLICKGAQIFNTFKLIQKVINNSINPIYKNPSTLSGWSYSQVMCQVRETFRLREIRTLERSKIALNFKNQGLYIGKTKRILAERQTAIDSEMLKFKVPKYHCDY